MFSRMLPAFMYELSASSGEIGWAEMVSVELWLSGVLLRADKLSHSSWVERGVYGELLNSNFSGLVCQEEFAKLFSVGISQKTLAPVNLYLNSWCKSIINECRLVVHDLYIAKERKLIKLFIPW